MSRISRMGEAKQRGLCGLGDDDHELTQTKRLTSFPKHGCAAFSRCARIGMEAHSPFTDYRRQSLLADLFHPGKYMSTRLSWNSIRLLRYAPSFARCGGPVLRCLRPRSAKTF